MATNNTQTQGNDYKINCETVNLKKGDKGDTVTLLQTYLKELGYYNATIDGDFGSVTENAVIKLQNATKHTPDGNFGPKTCPSLKSLIDTKRKDEKKDDEKKEREKLAEKKRRELEAKKRKEEEERRKKRIKEMNTILNNFFRYRDYNIIINNIHFISSSVELTNNISGTTWQSLEMMGDKTYIYQGHTQPTEYDITIPLPVFIYNKIKKHFKDHFLSAPVMVTGTGVETGNYVITITKAYGKGATLNLKFHLLEVR